MEQQIVRPDQIPALAHKMAKWRAVVFDTETTGLDWFLNDVPIGIGLSPFDDEKYYYLPIEGLSNHDLRPVVEQLEILPLIGHNIKFDLHMIKKIGWVGKQESFVDTIVMARIWSHEEKPRLGLEDLGKAIFNYQYPDEKVVRAIKGGRAHKISPADQALECIPDVFLTKELYKFFKRELSEELLRLFVKETRLTRDLYDIEEYGIMIDQEFLESATTRLDGELKDLLQSICTTAGMESFNPSSTPQRRELMEKLEIAPVKQAKTGPSWDREALLSVRHKHPVALNLAKYQALRYQRNGFIERAIQSREYLHGEFKNWGTVTGRLSSNLQQLPNGWLQFGEASETGEDVLVWLKDELAKEKEFSIRRLIRPRPGYVLIKADYRQIEMFVLGFIMNDKTFTSWLDSGNVHAAAAEEVFGDPVRDYDRGKVYNFATVYGQGDKARAEALGWTVEKSKEYRLKYEAKMPGHKKLLSKIRRSLYKEGYVENEYGRRYWLDPDIAYRGVNYVCQGSAGDYVKFKLPDTREIRDRIGLKVLITTHDDFIAEIPEENIHMLPEWMGELKKSPFGRELELDFEYGKESLVTLHPLKEILNAP